METMIPVSYEKLIISKVLGFFIIYTIVIVQGNLIRMLVDAGGLNHFIYHSYKYIFYVIFIKITDFLFWISNFLCTTFIIKKLTGKLNLKVKSESLASLCIIIPVLVYIALSKIFALIILNFNFNLFTLHLTLMETLPEYLYIEEEFNMIFISNYSIHRGVDILKIPYGYSTYRICISIMLFAFAKILFRKRKVKEGID